MFMYGSRLPPEPGGLVDNGLGKAVAYGRIGLLAPTLVVEQPTQELTLDGVRFERPFEVPLQGLDPGCHGLAIAIERGTPLADVLHAQAGDVLSGELEEELAGWQIKVGPREAVDLPRFLKTAW